MIAPPYSAKPSELKTQAPYKDLFPIKPVVLEKIVASMKDDGFLSVFPIAVWNGVVIDGHTRLAAAKNAHLREVQCAFMDFSSEDDAIDFAIKAQANRRNLTDGEILRCIETLDKRIARGGDRKSEESIAPSGVIDQPAPPVRSSTKTAEMLGISPRQVERARTINDHGSEDIKEAVSKGEKTISGAYNEVQAKRNPKPEPDPVEVVVAIPQSRERLISWIRIASETEIIALTAWMDERRAS